MSKVHVSVPEACSMPRAQVIFNDHLLHGSAARTNPGDRKMIVFRYLPQEQSTNRFGYEPSEALMQRLTPVRQQVSPTALHFIPA
jgi:hypothetical protein|eukprot:COSAG02_NODE_344_length_24146_cov_12.795983_18_plen_85_part_00